MGGSCHRISSHWPLAWARQIGVVEWEGPALSATKRVGPKAGRWNPLAVCLVLLVSRQSVRDSQHKGGPSYPGRGCPFASPR